MLNIKPVAVAVVYISLVEILYAKLTPEFNKHFVIYLTNFL